MGKLYLRVKILLNHYIGVDNMNKKIIISLFLGGLSISTAFADESSDLMKQQALRQLESVFSTEQRYMTFNNIESKVTFPTYIKTTLSTNWDFVIFNININDKVSESHPMVIDRVSISLDGITVARAMNLTLKPKTNNKYYFDDLKLNDYIRNIAKGYTVFGAFESINANQFLGFSEYRFKPLQITYAWHYMGNNRSNISTINLFIVMGKK